MDDARAADEPWIGKQEAGCATATFSRPRFLDHVLLGARCGRIIMSQYRKWKMHRLATPAQVAMRRGEGRPDVALSMKPWQTPQQAVGEIATPEWPVPHEDGDNAHCGARRRLRADHKLTPNPSYGLFLLVLVWAIQQPVFLSSTGTHVSLGPQTPRLSDYSASSAVHGAHMRDGPSHAIGVVAVILNAALG